MMHYMANAGGDFASIDKFKLKWNKIDQLGLIDPDHNWNTSSPQPGGYYAADQLIMQGGRWDFQIPVAIASGNYILRAETIALHNSMIKDGTQHYPQCINIEVTEGGNDNLSGGVIGTELYKPTDPGIGDFDIFVTNPVYSNYPIPGPPIHECGQKGYDQTPNSGSAPKWHGPDTAEAYGLNAELLPVGKIGVDPPNGQTYGKSPAATTTTDATTTTGATTAATTTAPAADEYPMTASAPTITPSAGSIPPVEVHTSWTPHQFMETNATATATGTYPTGTAVPVYGTPVDNSGDTNPPSSGSHPGSGYTDSGNTNGNTPSSTTGGTDNYSSGSTTGPGTYGGDHAGGDNTNTPSSATATGGNHPTSGSSPTSQNGNSGSDNHSTTGGSSTGSGTSPSSSTSPQSFVDNNNHDTCPEPAPAKVDSSATPTDDSTVAQLLNIMDLCLKKLKVKLATKLRRHARDILRARV